MMLVRFLRQHAAQYGSSLAIGVGAFLLARVFEALVPLFLKFGIDRLAANNSDILWPVAGIVAAVVARFAVVSYARLTVRRVGLNVAFDLRQRLYSTLQLQGSRFLSQYTIGDMMTRAVADISLIQRLISMGTILLVILVFASIVGFSFMVALAPTLTLLVLIPMPFVFLYAWYASRAVGATSQEVQERLSDLSAHVQENLSGIRTIQAMVQEDREIERFAQSNQGYADAFYRQSHANSQMTAVMPTLAAISAIATLGFGGTMVLDGTITIGTFAAFFMYLNMVVQPFRVAGFIVNLYQRAQVAARRLQQVFDTPPEIPDHGTPKAPIRGALSLRDVTWAYPDSDRPALNHIRLEIAEGETLVIMGRVGAGKSTLLKQLIRFCDPPAGAVCIDGIPVEDYPLAQLRMAVAYVPQEPFLFADTLRENISYDQPERSLDEVRRAVDGAGLRAMISQLPDGFDTILGERGVTLSGGQKQRTTLARGLIRQAPILLLDDCFSSVDTETEERILHSLGELRTGQTTIVVSHRVSTARHGDRIVVLDRGEIVEQGTHQQLLAAGGLYAEMARNQREGAGAAATAIMSQGA